MIICSLSQLVSASTISSLWPARSVNTLPVTLDASCWWWLLDTTNRCTICSTQVLNDLLLSVTKIALPNHNYLVSASTWEVVSTRWEVNASRCSFMAVESIKYVSLSQVPNLQSGISTSWQKEAPVRMESYLVHLVGVSVVVLQETLTTDVPDLYALVWAATGNASAVWVESNTVNGWFMVFKAFYKRLLCYIPKLYTSIIWAWSDEARVWRKLASSDPVGMSINREHKFAVVNCENFEGLVIRTRK